MTIILTAILISILAVARWLSRAEEIKADELSNIHKEPLKKLESSLKPAPSTQAVPPSSFATEESSDTLSRYISQDFIHLKSNSN